MTPNPYDSTAPNKFSYCGQLWLQFCQCKFLVYDVTGEDENAPLLAKECGHLTVKNYFSTGRFAFVRFVTNSKKEYRGFQIRFIVNDTRGQSYIKYHLIILWPRIWRYFLNNLEFIKWVNDLIYP